MDSSSREWCWLMGDLLALPNDGRGTVVARFLLGDIFEGGYDTSQCPECGLHLPRLVGPVGRMKDYDEELQLSKVKGTLINLYNFHDILTSMKNVAEWQVVISKKDNDPYEVDVLTLNISPRTGCALETLVENSKDRVSSVMELTPKVEIFHSCDNLFELMDGQIKPKRILDKRAAIKAAVAENATAQAKEVSKETAASGSKLVN